MKTLLIIGRKNGAGLDQDAALVGDALRADGWTVRHYAPREWRSWLKRDHADVVVHLERVFPLWRPKARTHVLIPNQERFPQRHLARLRRVDHVLCKTAHAQAIFSVIHGSVHQVGFTSPDRSLAGHGSPDYRRFFHLAGRSTVKGTATVLEAWRRHPEWPELVLVQHPDNAPKTVPANVTLLSRVVGDAELRALQNQCGVHLCPSLSEGWGHYIVEAMACRAVVVTTDGPPMNELVQPDRGVLLPYEKNEARHLGMDYHVGVEAVETGVARVLAMADADKVAMGGRARAWFEDNSSRFKTRLVERIAHFTQEKAGTT